MNLTNTDLTEQAIISLLNCNCVLHGTTIVSPADAVRPTDEAIAAEKVRLAEVRNLKDLRAQRNQLLSETDFKKLTTM